MKNAATRIMTVILMDKPPSDSAMDLPNQATMLTRVRPPAKVTKVPNQIKVFQAALLASTSLQSTTFSASIREKTTNATVVALN
ncbi:MAG: hypothetical protein DDT35_01288 [Firmicutes bacterium]|nr:hypothetical protein [Bacillota bacterium]